MIHLSQAFVHKQTAARHRLRDSYAWHRAIWTLFPDRPDGNRDFLFRLDDRRTEIRLLLLSRRSPVLPDWGRWNHREVSNGFLDHAAYRFQLKANPVMRRNADRRRVGIYDEPRLRDWIQRKGRDHGFDVAADDLSPAAPMEETFVREGRRGKHLAVDFSGRLRVTDRDAFRRAFQSGIGPAKAFGFGMLMLQPVRTDHNG